MNQLDFENTEGDLTIEGSYDYGTYDLNKSEVEQIIRFLQKWKSNN